MPFYDGDTLATYEKPKELEKPSMSFGDYFGEAFEFDTTPGMLGRYVGNKIIEPDNTQQEGFDPFAEENIKGWEQYADNFIKANNPAMMNHIKRQITEEEQHKEIMRSGGATAVVASLAAGFTDPVNFIPVGSIGTVAKGGRVVKGLVTGLAAGVTATAAYETVAQTTTQTRTAQESAQTIGFGTLLSGTIGAAIPAVLGKKSLNTFADTVAKETDHFASTVGAEQVVSEYTLKNTELKSMGGLDKLFGWMFPNTRLAKSPSLEARKASMGLAEHALELVGAQEGIAQDIPVQAIVAQWEAKGNKTFEVLRNTFTEYRTAAAKAGEKALNFQDFKEEIGRAMIRGDKHENPFIQRMAQEYRSQVYDPLKNRAIETGFWDKDVKVTTAESYLHRVYDRPKIIAKRPEFTRILSDYFKKGATNLYKREQEILREIGPFGNAPKGIDELVNIARKAKNADDFIVKTQGLTNVSREVSEYLTNKYVGNITTKDIVKSFLYDVDNELLGKASKSGAAATKPKQSLLNELQDLKIKQALTPEEWDNVAEDVVDTIIGQPTGGTPFNLAPLARGPLKDRTLLIPDELIEDFLERDIQKVTNRYIHYMAPDTEMKAKFGSTTMDDQFKAIREEYNDLRKSAGTNEKKLIKLQAQEEKDIYDLEALRQRIRGEPVSGLEPYRNVTRLLHVAKAWNYLRMLGGQTVSSIVDAGGIIKRNGFLKVGGDGIKPLISNWKAIKMMTEENKLAGAAWDLVNSQRAKTIYDIVTEHASQTKFERGVDWATDKFGFVTLMNHWNYGMKNFAGYVIQTNMNKTILNYGKAGQKEVARLATLGIGKKNVSSIASQLKKYAKDIDGVLIANTEAWDNAEAVRAWRAALHKEIHIQIIEPGQEVPIWINRSTWGFLAQFKTFAISSTQRILLTGLQDRDLATLNGIMFSMAMGAGAYYLKTPNEKLSDDPKVWAQEAVDRSGLTGITFDINNTLEKMSGGKVGISRLTGQQASRYASRNELGAALGPMFNFASDAAQVTLSPFKQGEFTKSDLHKVRQMLPLQNLFYIRKLVDAAEEGLAESLDLPDRTTPQRPR